MTNPFIADRFDFSWTQPGPILDHAVIALLGRHLERLNFTRAEGRVVEISALTAEVLYQDEHLTLPLHHLIRLLLEADSFDQAFARMKRKLGSTDDDKFGIRRFIDSVRSWGPRFFKDNPELVISFAAALAHASDLAYQRQYEEEMPDERFTLGRATNILRVVVPVLQIHGVPGADNEARSLVECRRLKRELIVLGRIEQRVALFREALDY